MENKTELVCEICGNKRDNKVYLIKEMHFGMGVSFEYFECNFCQCIQICKVPGNLSEYYPKEYYSFKDPAKHYLPIVLSITKFIKKRLVKYYCCSFDILGFCLSLFYKNPFPWIKYKIIDFKSDILDVGCGQGKLLLSMERSGFKKLTGIDPYIQDDRFYKNGIAILKKDLFCLEGKYDFIMLHHSFEHMSNPLMVLKQIYSLLKPGGYVLIRIPVTGGYAWRKYREKWVQLDAPRHLFIHSVQSMLILCDETKFTIMDIVYDSSTLQFTGSEMYIRNICLNSKNNLFSGGKMKYFQNEAIRLNNINDGDAACFYLKK